VLACRGLQCMNCACACHAASVDQGVCLSVWLWEVPTEPFYEVKKWIGSKASGSGRSRFLGSVTSARSAPVPFMMELRYELQSVRCMGFALLQMLT
jgi:hypothetical protein